jgi:hypothetical protein
MAVSAQLRLMLSQDPRSRGKASDYIKDPWLTEVDGPFTEAELGHAQGGLSVSRADIAAAVTRTKSAARAPCRTILRLH